jgi:DNA modification methylase
MLKFIEHSFHYTSTTLPLPPESCDLVFADPPYNQGIVYADDPTGDKQIPYNGMCADALQNAARLLRPGGTLWWLCPAHHMDWIPYEMSEEQNFIPLYRIVKEETFSQYQDRSLTCDYRMLFVGQKDGGKLTFNPDAIRVQSVRQEMGDKRANPHGRVPGQIWKFRRLQGTSRDRVDWHPAQLPPEFLKRIVDGWTNVGDTVIDLFAGSGSMGKVCKATGRNCILVDQSPTYLEKMKQELL